MADGGGVADHLLTRFAVSTALLAIHAACTPAHKSPKQPQIVACRPLLLFVVIDIIVVVFVILCGKH
jgi:hypothetical protein